MSFLDYVREQPTTCPLKSKVNIVMVDTETGGIPKNGVVPPMLGIGVVYVKKTDVCTIERTYEAYVRLNRADYERCHPKALEVNGITFDDLQRLGKPIDEIETDLLGFFSDIKPPFIWLGQNPGFDLKFVQEYLPGFLGSWLVDTDEQVWDLQDFYALISSRGYIPHLGNQYIKLEKMADALGVEPEPKEHKPLEGALLNHRVFTRLLWIYQNAENLKNAYYG